MAAEPPFPFWTDAVPPARLNSGSAWTWLLGLVVGAVLGAEPS